MTLQAIQKTMVAFLIVLVIYLDYRILELFLSPLAWAAILAILFYPLHRRIVTWTGKSSRAAFLSLVLVILLLVTPAIAVGAACIREGVRLFETIHQADVVSKAQEGMNWISERIPIPAVKIEDKLKEVAQTAGATLARWSARAVGNLAQLSFNLLVTGVGVFYLLRDGPEIVGFMKDTSPLEPETTERIIDEVSSMVTASVQSNVITACAQGFCATLVFWILGLPGPIFWGVVSGILAFLPIIAPALVWGGAAIYLLVGGQIVKGIAMLVLGTFLISGVDNVIRPAVIAGRAKMNGFVALISLFGGIFFFGFLGIVLGPLLAAVTTGLLKSYRESALQAQAVAPTDS